jgi:endonuclease/exonuclease/phosphatase (EEP) superfamily protein YafD
LGVIAALVAADRDTPTLVIGDFNLTVGSSTWSRFRKASRLSRPAGREPASWPWLLGPAGLTIDHILVRGVGADPAISLALPGSDHRGVIARVGSVESRH